MITRRLWISMWGCHIFCF